MFNIRETIEYAITAEATAATYPAPTTATATTALLHTLTNIEVADEVAAYGPLNTKGLFCHTYFQRNKGIHFELCPSDRHRDASGLREARSVM